MADTDIQGKTTDAADAPTPDAPTPNLFIALGIEFSRDDQLSTFILEETETEARIDWNAEGATSRSSGYQLNSFRHFMPMIVRARRDSRAAEMETARRVMRFVHDWGRTYSYKPDDPLGGTLDNVFAWYDMAVGMRAAMLGYLLSVAVEADFSEAHRDSLVRMAHEHAAYLYRKDLWSSHSNHGYYQSLGLFSMVVQAPEVFGEEAGELRRVAAERTWWYLDRAVSDDGVHLEHSPLYHIFIYRSVAEAAPWLDPANADEAAIARTYAKMQDALAAMFMPNGTLVPLGDSRLAMLHKEFAYSPEQIEALSPPLRAVFHRNGMSSAPVAETYANRFLATDTGLVANTQWGGLQSSYFVQTAQYHSAVHKQVDDMSVYWSENGMPILSDPGRYGYEGQTEDNSELRSRGFLYSDPNRIYVESAQAHNVVEIDDESDNRRNTPHYRSAVLGTAGDEHTLVTVCQRLREQLVGHNRVTIHRPGKFLLVVDDMTDLLSRDRTFTQWWNFFPSWRLKATGEDKGGARLLRATSPEGWQSDYLKGLKGKPRKQAKQVCEQFSKVQYDVGVAFDASVPVSMQTYFGEDAPRLAGWDGLASLVLRPSPALALRTEEPAPGQTVATLLSLTDTGAAVPTLTLVSKDDHTVVLRIGSKETGVIWTLYRGDGRLTLVERSADGEKLSGHVVTHAPVARLDQSDTLIMARARIAMGGEPDDIYEFFDAACEDPEGDRPIWADAAIEAADYARAQGDADHEVAYLQLAAKAGDGNGAMLLGQALLKDARTEEDFRIVETLLDQGAQSRIRSAYMLLGDLHKNKGPLQDTEKAIATYRQGALMGHPASQIALGRLLVAEGRTDEALPLLTARARDGSTMAAFALGDIYRRAQGVDADFEKALGYYRQAMEGGSRNAFYFAAQIVGDPEGPAHDAAQAQDLMEEASRRGVGNATLDLAKAQLEAGDYKAGFAKLALACKQGSKPALKFRKDALKMMGV